MFKKILVPVDGSEEAQKAVEITKELARCAQSSVTLLYVLAPLTMVATAAPGEERILSAIPELLVFRQNEGNAILEEMEGKFALTDIKPEKRMIEGHPARSILSLAKDENFDLIVMGSRGLSRIAGFLLGSISDAVVHHAHCPVLIVR